MPKKKSPNSKTITIQPDGRRTRQHTTTSGVVVTLSAFPPLAQQAIREALEAEWQEQGRSIPAKPTYQITTAAGDVETHAHDEQTIADNPEAKAAWDNWQTQTRAFENELRMQTMRALILDCIEFSESPSWSKRNKAKRIRVPDDPDERKLFYARTTVLVDVLDFVDVMKITAELAGATEQQMAAVRDSFQHSLEGDGRTAPGEPETEGG